MARNLLADGADPSEKRKAVAAEWLETKLATLTASTWNRDRDQLVKMASPTFAVTPSGFVQA